MTVLTWGIKSSLLSYVRGMPDGRVELSDGAEETASGFAFPGDRTRFRGAVTLTGHNGMMRVRIGDPALVQRDGRWTLEIADPDDPTARLVFAVLGEFDGSVGRDVSLTDDGADLFFGPYRAGTPLDDIAVAP